MANTRSDSRNPDINSAMTDMLLTDRNNNARKRVLKTGWRPAYKTRMVKNKGAIVILIRNFFVAFFFSYILLSNKVLYRRPYFITLGITLPLIGWLADVCLGRHKVIHWSVCIMWAGFMLATVSSVVAQLVESYTSVLEKVSLSLLILATAGLGGYVANVIQLEWISFKMLQRTKLNLLSPGACGQ